MEQIAKVVKTGENARAQVLVIRQSACSGDCHKCSGCGAVEQKLLLDVRNTVGAEAGDRVVIRTESGPVLAAAAVLYLLPLALFFPGYILGEQLWQRGGLAGCCGFAVGLLLAVGYDRLVARKKKTEYTITGFAHTEEA